MRADRLVCTKQDATPIFSRVRSETCPSIELGQMLEGGLDVFDSYVDMTRFAMFDGFFQMLNPFAHL